MRNLKFRGILFGKQVYLSQVSKTKAKKLHSDGVTVFIQSSNHNPLGFWSQAYPIVSQDISEFETSVNSFSYYNCNNKETGLYPVFYVDLLIE